MTVFSTFSNNKNKKISTIDKIIAGFPHRGIPNFFGVPTYTNIKEVSLLLISNAVTVYSNQINGSLVHLALTITPNTDFTLTGIIFQPPVNPGPMVVVPPLSIFPVIVAIKYTYKESRKEWDRFTNINGALKHQLLLSVDPVYIKALRNRYTVYRQCTT